MPEFQGSAAKFQTAEDLAKAYNELERKLGQQAQPQPQPQPQPVDLNAALAPYYKEVQTSGTLSPESVARISESTGLPASMVDLHVRGVTALRQQVHSQLHEAVGGQEQFQTLVDWAKQNQASAVSAINDQLSRADVEAAKVALMGLKTMYEQSNPTQITPSGGMRPQDPKVQPFEDWSEVTQAMADDRYARDRAYRKEVEDRMAVSQLQGVNVLSDQSRGGAR